MPSGSSGNKSGSKSAKAMKKVAKQKGGVPGMSTGRGGALSQRRQIPWMTIGAVVAVLALVAVLGANLYPKYQDRQEAQKFAPSESNTDPSTAIEGVDIKTYPAALHVSATQRVAYDQSPPFGGPHDQVWADCMGTVYPSAIRSENAVHSLEHGAVWITYNPDELDQSQIDSLAANADGQPYTMMSPYPGLDSPLSLQSWGHQLKLDSVDDPRIDQFITALRLNSFGVYPEINASCSTTPATFDVDNPPPFDPTPPGADAVPMDGAGITPDATETGGAMDVPPTDLVPAPAAP